MRAVLALAPLVALAAPAATQPAPAASQSAPYRATGTEPFWSLTFDARTMRLEEPGRRPFAVARPVPRPSFNGERYVTRAMTVDVTHAPCSDGMSGRVYRDTVTVQVGRRTLKGCGGDQRGPDIPGGSRLSNTNWTVHTVNGRRIQTYQPLTVNFTRDRIEGKLCNGFGGGYTMRGDRLSVGPVMSTKMACRGPAQVAETTIFAMWRQPVRATVSRWGTLILERGRDTVTLRPARR